MSKHIWKSNNDGVWGSEDWSQNPGDTRNTGSWLQSDADNNGGADASSKSFSSVMDDKVADETKQLKDIIFQVAEDQKRMLAKLEKMELQLEEVQARMNSGVGSSFPNAIYGASSIPGSGASSGRNSNQGASSDEG